MHQKKKKNHCAKIIILYHILFHTLDNTERFPVDKCGLRIILSDVKRKVEWRLD